MENLDSRVKDLSDENEQLKKENSKLLTRIHTLEMEVCNKKKGISIRNQSFLLLFRMIY